MVILVIAVTGEVRLDSIYTQDATPEKPTALAVKDIEKQENEKKYG